MRKDQLSSHIEQLLSKTEKISINSAKDRQHLFSVKGGPKYYSVKVEPQDNPEIRSAAIASGLMNLWLTYTPGSPDPTQGESYSTLKYGEELAYRETIDMGMLYKDSFGICVPHIANMFYYYGGWSSKIEGSVKPVEGELLAYTVGFHDTM